MNLLCIMLGTVTSAILLVVARARDAAATGERATVKVRCRSTRPTS